MTDVVCRKMCIECLSWALFFKIWADQKRDLFRQYEIVAGPLVKHEGYRFWWMFLTRNFLDRILPFFALVAMNYTIIKALKKEYVRQGSKQRINGMSTKTNRSSLRDATRALIGVVSMYIMSQFLQVFV